MVVGTSKGFIHVYETQNIKKDIKYHEFSPHCDDIRDIKFLVNYNKFMLCTASLDKCFVLICLTDCI